MVKSGSKSRETSSRKVCFLSFVRLKPQIRDRFVDVYVFDLDRNESLDLDGNPRLLHGYLENVSVSVAPALRFRQPYAVATCVLDSKLYLFPGYDAEYNPKGKSVRYYDLSSPPPDPDAESTLCSGMCGKKLAPAAIPTPDCRKIVVLSTCINQNSHEMGFVDFELYDYVNRTSAELPRLPRGGKEYIVTAYYFVSATTFAVITVSSEWGLREAYTLDLSQKEEEGSYRWETSEEGEILPLVGGEGFQICGGACLVSKFGLYERSSSTGCIYFPHDPKVEVDGYSRRFFLAAPLDNSPEGDEVCVCYVELKCRVGRARVFINVHRMNPATGLFERDESGFRVTAPEKGIGYVFKLTPCQYSQLQPLAFQLDRSSC